MSAWLVISCLVSINLVWIEGLLMITEILQCRVKYTSFDLSFTLPRMDGYRYYYLQDCKTQAHNL